MFNFLCAHSGTSFTRFTFSYFPKTSRRLPDFSLAPICYSFSSLKLPGDHPDVLPAAQSSRVHFLTPVPTKLLPTYSPTGLA